MSNSLGSLVIELGANIASLQSDFARAQTITDRAVADINLKINSIGSSANFSSVSSQVQSLTNDFATLKSVVGGVFGVSLGIGGLKEIQTLADDYQNVSNRIQTTVSSSQQLVAVQGQVFAIAQETARSLDDTAKTYQRLEQAIQSSGVAQAQAQAQALQITKTLNQEIVVSGANAGEASRSIMDLVHGLSGGTIQARQFNQVMRQMPDLAKVIADGLGVSVKQLEAMVHAGLPAEQLLSALAKESSAVEARFNALPKTFAQTWTVLANAVEQYIGKAAQASAVSDLLKSAIVGIANNIGAVAVGAEAVGAAMAVWLGGKGVNAISGLAVSLYEAATAQGAYKTATIISTEADLANAAAVATSAAATRERVVQVETLKLAELDQAQAARAALVSEIQMQQAYAATAPAGVTYVGTIERIVAAKAELVAADAAVLKAEESLLGIEARLAIAAQAETAATAELAASKVALAGAQAEASTASSLFARVGGGLFAMIGGWPTVLLAAAAGFVYLATRTTEVQDAVAELEKRTEELNAKIPSLTQAFLQLSAGEQVHKQSLVEVTQAHLANAEALMKDAEQAKGSSADYAQAADAVQYYKAQLESLQGAAASLSLAHLREEVFSVIGVMQGAVAAAQNWKQGMLDAVGSNAAALDKEAAALQKHADSIGKTKTQLVELEKEQKTLSDGLHTGVLALDATGAAVIKNAEAYGLLKKAEDDQYTKILAAAKAYDVATAAQKGLGQARKDAATDLKLYNQIEAEGVKASNDLLSMQIKLDGQIKDGTAKAWDTYDQQLIRIVKDYNAMQAAANANGVALSSEQVTRYTQAVTDNADALQRNIQISQALDSVRLQEGDAVQILIDKYREEDDSLSQSLPVRERVNAELAAEKQVREAVNKAIRDGHPEYAAQLQDLIATAKGHADYTIAMKANEEQLKQWQQIATSGFDSVANSLAGFATGSIKNWHDLGSSLVKDTEQWVAQIIAEILKLTIFNGIINNLFGSNLPTGLGSLAGIGGGGGAGGISDPSGAAGLLAKLFGGGGSATGATSYNSLSSGSEGLEGIGSAAYGGIGSGFGYGSGLSSAIGAAGALFAGYNEFKAAGGGIAGLAGGAAYGIGTYAIGGAISAGVSAAAAGGISAGISAGLGAIPVVGWIGIAALVIDKVSGGKLFGTAWSPTGNSSQSIAVGASGASLTNYTEESKQGALFSGKKWKEAASSATADQQTSVDTLFKGIQDSIAAAAAGLGVTAGALITGSFKEVFDKSGKVTSQLSTIMGQTYSETVQQFAERVTADNLLALLPAAQNAQEIAAKWQSSADSLLAGTAFLVQAQADINRGTSLISGVTSLSAIDTEVEKLSVSGETLIQTYVRLSAEETDLSGTLSLLGLSTGKTGTAFLEFADSLATAAGGLKNLDTLWSAYYGEFYSQSEQQANTLKALQANVTQAFTAIGENSGVSMAQFRKDFEAALPSLTPQQVVEWLLAGDALSKLNTALTQTGAAASNATSATAQAYKDFVTQFNPQTLGLTTFETSVISINGTMQQNIDKANALAKANGMSGASLTDIGNIIQASAEQGVKALQQLEAQATQLAASLYGTGLDQLNAQLKAAQDKFASDSAPGNETLGYALSGIDQKNIDAIKAQIDAQNKQAEQAKRLTDSMSLLGTFEQIGAVTGESLNQLGARFSVPLDKFATDLGISQAVLSKQFTQGELQVTAAVRSADLLQNILNAITGKSTFAAGNVVARGGVPGQPTTFGEQAPISSAQANTMIAHLQRIVTHTGGTAASTSDLLRKTNTPLPFGRNTRAPA